MERKYWFLAVFFLLGLSSGWALRSYWENQERRAESLMLVGESNEALRKGDIDTATDLAIRAVARNHKSFLAVLLVAELYDKRGSNQIAIKYYQNALEISRKDGREDDSIQRRLEILTNTAPHAQQR